MKEIFEQLMEICVIVVQTAMIEIASGRQADSPIAQLRAALDIIEEQSNKDIEDVVLDNFDTDNKIAN